MSIENRIGISALSLKGMPLEDAIDAARGAGLNGFELVPRLYGGPRGVSQEMRKMIKQKLACFDTVTVHTSAPPLADGRPADIASADGGVRAESTALYLDHVRLALDLGARAATFHPAKAGAHVSPEQVRKAHADFAAGALSLAAGTGLKMGFEYFDPDAAAAIGAGDFGILFDIGHAGMAARDDMTGEVIRMMNRLKPFIVQFHLHGIRMEADGKKEDHRNFRDNNGLDYGRIIRHAKKAGLDVPHIFEIGIRNDDVQQNLRDTVAAAGEVAWYYRS